MADDKARRPNDPGRYFVERANAGDATVELAHRQPDGCWLWAVDQPSLPR